MAWLREDVLTLVPHVVPYLLLTAVVGLFISWYIKRMQKVALIEKIPGPPALPLLGNALDINVEPREVFRGICCLASMSKGALSRVWLGLRPLVVASSCQQVEVILSSNRHIDKSRDYSFLHPWLGTGLLTSSGQKWHSRRKLLTPAFHFKILEDFLEVFNSQSDVMVKKLQLKADGKPFDIFPHITHCALDIICETAMGHCLNVQGNSDSEYVRAVYRITALIQQRQARPWLQPNLLFKLFGYAREHDSALKILHDMSYDCIRKRRVQYQEKKKNKKNQENDDDVFIGKKERLAFLDLLLEAAEKDPSFTDEDIREEVDTFMFEGHDTTAAAINWSLYLLGCHPEIQARVHEELDAVLGDEDRPITMNDLRELKTTENCIKEALRLFPSVPFIARELKEEAAIDNYRIPVGTTVMIVTFRLHRDPEQFPLPEVFNPDRFLPENCLNRHPYAYVPFSAGPRNCIGQKFAMMEEKIVLSSILKKFRVESTTRREDLKLLGELILRPEDGNTVKLIPREKS